MEVDAGLMAAANARLNMGDSTNCLGLVGARRSGKHLIVACKRTCGSVSSVGKQQKPASVTTYRADLREYKHV